MKRIGTEAKVLLEMVDWTDEIESAWKRYADSHYIPPANPYSSRLKDQLSSVIPMGHTKETFRRELINNDKFFKKWMIKTAGKKLGPLYRGLYQGTLKHS